ncbi:MAG TPA: PIN domain-containing protein [Bryobacteraceae bacterium]|nr:PIN domain-containing protein [Bryobacteraceae bacterium]
MTNPRLWDKPKSSKAAFGFVRELLAQPRVVLIQTGPRHIEILEEIVSRYGIAGTLVSDAVLAAMAIESGATLASTDRHFSRFENLRWINPLAVSSR